MKAFQTIIAVCLCSIASALGQGLIWQTKVLEEHVNKGESAEFEFHFTNEADTDVAIVKIQSSCGCAVGKSEKSTFISGEKGVISVKLGPRHKVGREEKYVLVSTNYNDDPTRLTIKLNITDTKGKKL